MAAASPSGPGAGFDHLSELLREDDNMSTSLAGGVFEFGVDPSSNRKRSKGKARKQEGFGHAGLGSDVDVWQPKPMPEPPLDEFREWMNGYRNILVDGEDVGDREQIRETNRDKAFDRRTVQAASSEYERKLNKIRVALTKNGKVKSEISANTSEVLTRSSSSSWSEVRPPDTAEDSEIGPSISVSRRNSLKNSPRGPPTNSRNDAPKESAENILPPQITTGLTRRTTKAKVADVGSHFVHARAEKSKKTPRHSREVSPERGSKPSPKRSNPDPLEGWKDLWKDLSTPLFDAAKSDLFYTVATNHDPTKPKTAILNLCTLQHLELRMLQYTLAKYVGDMYSGDSPPLQTSVTLLLREYCDGVRNLDFMKECALRGYEDDPFILKTSRAIDRRILEAVGLVPNHLLPKGQLPSAEDAENPRLRTSGRNKANEMARAHSRSSRLLLATAGGLSLIGPMLIMANVPGRMSSLVTTCVSMLIFVVFIAFFTELGPNEVLATTAAYAAVLVVFVGTSLNGGGRITQ